MKCLFSSRWSRLEEVFSPIWRWKVFSSVRYFDPVHREIFICVSFFRLYLYFGSIETYYPHTVVLLIFFFFECVPHIFREIVSKHSSKIIHTFQILFGLFLFVTKKTKNKPKQLINKFLQFLFFHWLLKKWKKKYSINVTNLFRSNWLWLKG